MCLMYFFGIILNLVFMMLFFYVYVVFGEGIVVSGNGYGSCDVGMGVFGVCVLFIVYGKVICGD